MASVGMHCLLEIYGCPESILDDAAFIQKTLHDAATSSGATWLGEVAHKFEPNGVTALGLLAESHISIHTWPEIGYAAVDVFTCGDHAMPENACRYLIEHLKAERHTLARIPRATRLRPREVQGVDKAEAHMASVEAAPLQALQEITHEVLTPTD